MFSEIGEKRLNILQLSKKNVGNGKCMQSFSCWFTSANHSITPYRFLPDLLFVGNHDCRSCSRHIGDGSEGAGRS